MIGKKISSYKILELIGKGGMSHVYLGRNIKTGSLAAIKILRKQYTQEEDYINRFFTREVEVTKSLHHKNIVNLFGYGKSRDIYYLVYEYIQGVTLDKYIKNSKKPSIKTIENIALQILSGLSYAHSLGIIHRDIKPQNILITNQGIAKITDFGIAKALSSTTITQTGMFMGSPGYISPEQADPNLIKGEKLDIRSDIYSMGILLFEMLTGKLPFTSDTPWGIVHKHIKEPAPNIKTLNKNIPDYLSYIVMKCLVKDRNGRFKSVNEIANIIRQKTFSINNIKDTSSKTVIIPSKTNLYDKYSNAQPIWKLFLLSILTVNLYNYYWYYRNWHYLRKQTGLDIKPGLRTLGLFVPILGWILVYNQFDDIRSLSVDEGVGKLFSPGLMIFLMILFTVASRALYQLLFITVPLSVLPIAIAQNTFNYYWKKVQPGLRMKTGLGVGEIIALVLVIITWIIVIMSLSV